MAVFKPDLSFTTIQDKQLKALESLNDICSKDFDITKNIYDSVEKHLPDVIYSAANVIVHGIDAIWNGREFSGFSQTMDSGFRDMREAIEEIQEDLENPPNPPDDPPDPTEKLEELIDTVKDLGKKLWSRAVDDANVYSDLYNQTLKFIGVDKEGAQQFRRDIVDTVSDLNSELGGIGGKLDPKESLATMLAISNSTNISNTKTLEALTRPILLAQETTNVNTAELAKLGARLYTRYNFSATSLEHLVDHIRNTAQGKDVSEDAMLQAASMIETAAGYYYEDNKEALESMIEATTTAQAFFESNYVDSTPYMEDMRTILTGNALEISELARKYGSDFGEIKSLIASGTEDNILAAYELMAKSISEWNTNNDSYVGVSHDMVMEAAQISTSMDEFRASIDEQNSAAQRAADKYVSIEEQVYNKLSEATSYLATMQESLGVGMSDIALLVSTVGNVSALLGGKNLSGLLGSGGIAGFLKTGLGKAGPIGLGVAALATVTTGVIKDSLKTIEEVETAIYEDKFGALEEGINLTEEAAQEVMGYMYQYTYKDGEKDWEQVLVNKDQYTDASGETDWDAFYKDQATMLSEYNADLMKEASTPDTFGQKALDFVSLGISRTMRESLAGVNALMNRGFNSIQDELIASELGQLYMNNGLLSSENAQAFFYLNYDRIQDLYEEGKVLMTKGKDMGKVIDASHLEYPGSFDVGTNYVTHDQLAYIHKGEAIVPEKYNPAAHMNELERLRSQKDVTPDLSSMVGVLTEIRDFMQYWKKDVDQRDVVSRSKSINTQRLDLLRFSTGR